MKKVSIITACINLIKEDRKEFFKQMFESIQGQTYINIEHIIIDGASKDGSQDLIQDLITKATNKNIDIKFISEADTGVYNAMNKGVKKSTGDYFIFMNSDDYYKSKDAIKVLVETLEKNNADLSTSAVETINVKKNTTAIKRAKPKTFVWRMPFCHQTLLSKRELFDKYGGLDENYRISADYDFIFKSLMNRAKISKTNDVLVSFRNVGLSSQDEARTTQDTLCILEKYYGKNLEKKLISKIYKQNIGILDYIKILQTDFDPNLKQALLKQLNLYYFIKRMRNILKFRGLKKYIKSKLDI